jgi:hypothetical protein
MLIYIDNTNQCRAKRRLHLLEIGMKKPRAKVIFFVASVKTENQ